MATALSARGSTKTLVAALAVLLILMLNGAATIPANSRVLEQESAPDRRGPLTSGDRAKLALLSLRGVRQVHVHIACRAGMTATVAQQIEARSGTIRFRTDEIAYLRAWLPFDGVDSVANVASLPGVEALAVSWSGQNPSPLASFPVDASPNAGRDSRLPTLATPHSLAADLDATDFFRDCPTCDGRGVTIAILDGVPDLLHPNLQRALDLEGRPVRKFLDATSTARALDEPGDRDWARMDPPVQSERGQLTFNGSRYRVPQDGTYRVGSIPRQRMGSYEAWVPLAVEGNAPLAIDRDNQTHQIAVLWDEVDDTVWVDTNVNGSFADEQALRPYRVRGDVGVFGRDDPATPIRESVGFTITIDHEAKAVRINPAWQIHGTIVSGAAAGEGYLDGRFNAVAGNARLALYEISSSVHTYNIVETVLEASRDSEVDVIVIERDTSVFGDYTLNDGRNAISIVLDRIAERFRKPIFVTAGNLGGLSSVGEPSTAQHVIGIGAYDSAQALRTFHAIEPPYSDNLHRVGSFGPGGDGRLKPDLVAPATQLTTDISFASALVPIGLTGHYQLPPGNTLSGGTSSATPIAAAAASLLISAAKQRGVRWDSDRLKYALYSTARALDRIPTYRQGRGLIQIGKAWDVLKELDKIPDWAPAEIDISASVRTATSRLLQEADRGIGIYEKEGWGPYQSSTRTIVFTRRNGPKESVIYQLDWQGNRETFSSASSLTLPLNEPVSLPVEITTRESGVYSALLRLTQAGIPVEAASVLNTVVAAADLDEKNGFVIDRRVAVDRPGMTSLFFRVPRGMSALQITAAKASPEELAIYYRSPDLSRVDGNRVFLREGTKHVVIPNPLEGVWELCLDSRALLLDINRSWKGKLEPRPNPLTPTDVQIVLKALRVEASAKKEQKGTGISIRNMAAALRGRPMWQGIGREVRQSWNLRPNQQQSFDVSVPAGTKFLKVEVDQVSEPANLRLLLYEVVNGQAIFRSWMASANGAVPIAIRDPKPGTWKAVLDIQSTQHASVRGIYRHIIAHDCPNNDLASLPPFRLDRGGAWTHTFACRSAQPRAGQQTVGVMLFDALPAVENQDTDLTEAKPLIDVIVP